MCLSKYGGKLTYTTVSDIQSKLLAGSYARRVEEGEGDLLAEAGQAVVLGPQGLQADQLDVIHDENPGEALAVEVRGHMHG